MEIIILTVEWLTEHEQANVREIEELDLYCLSLIKNIYYDGFLKWT